MVSLSLKFKSMLIYIGIHVDVKVFNSKEIVCNLKLSKRGFLHFLRIAKVIKLRKINSLKASLKLNFTS